MQILYTLPNCPHCEEARAKMNGDQWREVVIDNPLLEVGFRAMIGKVMAPVLVKEDGNLYFLVDVGAEKKFVRLLV
jgi:glutaredoxin 2